MVDNTDYPTFENEDYIGLNGTTVRQLHHPHFEKWQVWLTQFYKAPKNKIAIFLPCTAIKPYDKSPIHKRINNILCKYGDKIHKLVLSTAGIVPYEFKDNYPFESYDWNPYAAKPFMREAVFTTNQRRFTNYLQRHDYSAYIAYCHLESVNLDALKTSMEILNKKLVTTPIAGHIESSKDEDLILTYPHNLHTLENIIKEINGQ